MVEGRLQIARRFGAAALLSALVSLAAVRGAQAGVNVWTTNGPEGGEVWGILALAVDPQNPAIVYAGTSSAGVFKSTDGGGTWSAVNTGLINKSPSSYEVRALAVDPQTPTIVYARTKSGLFKSTDGGAQWSLVLGYVVSAVVIDPQTPTTLYAGSDSGGVYRSIDGGANWSFIGSTNPFYPYGYAPVAALAVDPQTPTTLYAGTGSAVFRSTDGGTTWSAVLTGQTVDNLAIDPQ